MLLGFDKLGSFEECWTNILWNVLEICIMFFHDYDGAMRFWGGRPQKCCSHHIISRGNGIIIPFAVDIDLNQLANVVFFSLIHWKVPLYVSIFPTVPFSKKSLCTVFIKGEMLYSATLRTECLQKLLITLSLFCIGGLSLIVLLCWSPHLESVGTIACSPVIFPRSMVLKMWPWTSSLSITWEFIRHASYQALFHFHWIRNLGARAQISVFGQVWHLILTQAEVWRQLPLVACVFSPLTWL